MNKQILKEAYDTLNTLYEEYWILMQKKAKSKKSELGSKELQMDNIRNRVKQCIDATPFLYEYIEYPDEFFSYQWFEEDFKSLLIKLKDAYETF